MRIEKFLKHVDFFTDVEVFDKEDRLLYRGSVIPFHVMSRGRKNEIEYLKDSLDEKSYETIAEYEEAVKIKGRKLNTTKEYEAVFIDGNVNEHGVKKFVLHIYVK